ncbi:hypothetical protein CR205_08745 [Alteribacter lacisalsi]|uniref:LysM domain-containing protein n=1 Tax=Alteribacter lacisalsi TaxID=2045244 RepID=A0A2W0HXY7_9BACI|nr:hypothetical protein [Alteribacter lacisalsi]PYZ98648.1 hypothetical protein CR205_08745 [Alteribacter lacisalsi]
MKQVLVFGLVVVLAFSVYYDLTEGTLPDRSGTGAADAPELQEETPGAQEQEVPPPLEISYQEVIVQSGHTVYTIVQALHQGQVIEANFERIVTDFELLNPQTDAHAIQTGQTYRFPIYPDQAQLQSQRP